MGQNCEKFIGMCMKSIKTADAIVYIDGGSTDLTISKVYEFYETEASAGVDDCHVIENAYNQEDKSMNGKQRNYYLNHLKRHYPNDWCLCLDADEVVGDLEKIKEFIQTAVPAAYNVKMRHFQQDLGHEDATQEKHWVLHRLFKISEADYYPNVEHPVLIAKTYKEALIASQHTVLFKVVEDQTYYLEGFCDKTTIWHLAYIPNLWDIKKRFDSHMKKSNMHTPEYLNQWYRSHLFGSYPKKNIDLIEIPDIILNEFSINKDELYFTGRGLELKHFIDACHWRDFFKLDGKLILEVGCGLGPRVYAMNQIGLMCDGIEKSQYAVDRTMVSPMITQGDITQSQRESKVYDLIIAYDILEHIEESQLELAIDNLIKLSKQYILVSVPVIGDPNLERDPTHKIKQTKEWWIEQFTSRNCKLIKTPEHFLYHPQVMIFEVEQYL